MGFNVGSLHAYSSSLVKMNMGEYPIQYPELSDSQMAAVNRMIKQLTAARSCKVQKEVMEAVTLNLEDIALVCKNVHGFFMAEPGLIKLNAPINVVGDIHGQFLDLLRYFEVGGFPPDSSYLFLGDFVDRGKMGVECTMLLFCYKLKYPNLVYLLRGNHECISTSRFYGFHDECQKRFNTDTWRHVNAVFRALPIAATIDERIFCTHGGLSPELKSLDDILRIPRPTDLTVEGLLCDLLWSDPSTEIDTWAPSDRGVSWLFGREVLDEFLKKNNFDLFVRAHQVVEAGFEFFPKDTRQLVTVFSAVNYCGHFDNAGAMLIIDKEMTCSFRVLRPPEHQTKEEEKTSALLKRPPTSGNIIRPEAPSVD
eukprot:CAMPEP_0204863194 /NCGR_PEP_ID=MMETSP1348-20121228/3129_1 /ASSEMBLY_ACC=CAM_ASM_000700 /TAXON_ID=215587 /ORGANISM="Aplanochytrium stocchinoi, Strain GSBS06" /LENGTH=366 /DNA_ID=CAMNT_0052013447 /DNA_START=175 /DNA_END=1275 /DNA_ORIENTATION=+